MSIPFHGRLPWLLIPSLATACAVGPDFKTPAVPDVSGYTRETMATTATTPRTPLGEAQHFVSGMDLPAEWWTA